MSTDVTNDDWHIERSWTLYAGPEQEPQQRKTEQLADFSALALLGAAGTGKTYELKHLASVERQRGVDIRFCRLAVSAGSGEELRHKLSELSEGASSNTSIYLDALDEAMINVRLSGSIISQWIQAKLIGTGANFRITCRSAVWPGQLSEMMSSIYGDAQFGRAILQPLTLDEILRAVESFGLDSEKFRMQLQSSGTQALAEHPLMLRMLIKLFKREEILPTSRRTLFQEGLQELAGERQERRELGTAPHLSHAELLDTAERVACYSLLSGKETVDLRDDPSQNALRGSELNRVDVGSPRLDDPTLRALGYAGFVESDSPSTFHFGHRQYAEYLAGRKISKTLPHQAQALLANEAGRHVAGPLRETAAFAAMESSEIAEWITRVDPEIIGLSDVADPHLRKQALIGLFDKFRSFELTATQLYVEGLVFDGFRYDGVEIELKKVLNQRETESVDCLLCALSIIDTWRLESLSADLASLALDSSAPLPTRTKAASSLAEFGTETARHRIKPLVYGVPEDSQWQLKGYALECNWPQNLSVSELLDNLAPEEPSNFSGQYRRFLSHLDHSGFHADGELVKGLLWAKQRVKHRGESDSAHRLAIRIAHAAFQEVSDPAIADALTGLMIHCAANHLDSPLSPLRTRGFGATNEKVVLNAPLPSDPSLRRELIDRLSLKPEVLVHVVGFAYRTPGLCDSEDFDWLLRRSLDNSRTLEVRTLYARLLRYLPLDSGERIDALLRVHEQEPLKSVFQLQLSTRLDSEEAAKQREEWRQMLEMERTDAPVPLEPPPQERVLTLLDHIENNEPTVFRTLTRELTLEPLSTHYGFGFFLTDTPGWAASDATTRKRIIEAAKSYLLSDLSDPEACIESEFSKRFIGGMAAMWLIVEIDPSWFDCREQAWWERWGYFILRELHPGLSDEPSEPKQLIFELLYRKAPHITRDCLLEFATQESLPQNFFEPLMELMAGTQDDDFDQKLCALVAKCEISVRSCGSAVEFLLVRQPDETINVCTNILASEDESVLQRFAVPIATSLLIVSIEDSWPQVSRFIKMHGQLGKELFASYADSNRWNRIRETDQHLVESIPSQILGEITLHLMELYPPEDDPQYVGARHVSHEDSARDLRLTCLQLLGNRAEEGAVRALRKLEAILSDRYSWIRDYRASAQRAYRMVSWRPIPLKSIADILSSADKRLMRSPEDVLDGIEFCLKSLAESIRTDGPGDVEDYWNTPHDQTPSPKEETLVSKKLCDEIREYFGVYAVAADREIEIRHRKLPKKEGGEPGSELDVLVQIPAAGTSYTEQIRIPIEVKRSCNPEAKTGMKDQLADRYLPELGAMHGVFVVAWLDLPQRSDLLGHHRPKWSSIEEAKSFLSAQADQIREQTGYEILPIVLDLSLY